MSMATRHSGLRAQSDCNHDEYPTGAIDGDGGTLVRCVKCGLVSNTGPAESPAIPQHDYADRLAAERYPFDGGAPDSIMSARRIFAAGVREGYALALGVTA